MSQRKWEYNGLEFEADFEDVNFLENYSKAMHKLSNSCKTMPKDGTDLERIKTLCYCIENAIKNNKFLVYE
uniref:hypothetical protein n=1 Tax=Thomasclavelia cocleata TaxID=69824 RepID=UPI0024314457